MENTNKGDTLQTTDAVGVTETAKLNIGCGKSCRVSQLTDEEFVCGADDLSGSTFLCDDCIRPAEEKLRECKTKTH